MLKRLFAAMFILILAGQVWAGVCGCLQGSGEPKMKCCKRSKAVKTISGTKACCGSVCGNPSNDRQPRSQGEASMKVPAPVIAAVEKLVISFDLRPRSAFTVRITDRDAETPNKLANPPDLFIKNHAFLI